jgi:hypothetical protein
VELRRVAPVGEVARRGRGARVRDVDRERGREDREAPLELCEVRRVRGGAAAVAGEALVPPGRARGGEDGERLVAGLVLGLRVVVGGF